MEYRGSGWLTEAPSHHPPVTAYCIWNSDHGVRLQGYNGQKVSFSRTINIKVLCTLRSQSQQETS